MNNTLNTFTTHLRIFCALLHRDFKMFRQTFRRAFIDSLAILFVQLILFGGLLPHFGMPRSFIAPLYLGNVVGFMFHFGYSQAFLLIADLQYSRFIDYHLTLPLPKRWLFAKYITYFMIEAFVVTIPLVSLGIILLGEKFTTTNPSWGLFALMYFCMVFFFTTLFTWIGFHYDYAFFNEHIWPRRLSPLFNFCTVFFTWKSVYALSPAIAYLFLANPVTYVSEGLRAALLDQVHYLPFNLCLCVAFASIIIFIFLLSRAIKKRLDPV